MSWRPSQGDAAAAGWYMWPDPCLPYPLGTGTYEAPEPLTPQADALCALDLLILVGKEDVDQDVFLERAYRGYDLTRL